MDTLNLIIHVLAGLSFTTAWCVITILRCSLERWVKTVAGSATQVEDTRPRSYHLFQNVMLLVGLLWITRATLAFLHGDIEFSIGGYPVTSPSFSDSFNIGADAGDFTHPWVPSYALMDVAFRESSWLATILLWPYPMTALLSVVFNARFTAARLRDTLSFSVTLACVVFVTACSILEAVDGQFMRMVAFWVLFTVGLFLLGLYARFFVIVRHIEHRTVSAALRIVMATWVVHAVATALGVRMAYLGDSGYGVPPQLCVGGAGWVVLTALATLGLSVWVEVNEYDRVIKVHGVRDSMSMLSADIP